MSGLIVERTGELLNITFNRPENLNAVHPEEVGVICKELENLNGVKAVVFRGAGGRAFSTGMHVAAFETFDEAGALDFITTARDLLAAIRKTEVVTISVIDGYCLGIGFETALACDIRVATPGSKFGLPEIKVGFPAVLDSSLLRHYVGLGLSKEIILTGDAYPLAALAPYGVFNAVVERDELEGEVERLLGLTTRHTAVAVAAQKRLFETWLNTGVSESNDLSMGEFTKAFTYPETLEQFARYRESVTKKKP
ncbi:enoyl-CoA hydratase/isomerase family protein [Nocardia sp. NPDC055029]